MNDLSEAANLPGTGKGILCPFCHSESKVIRTISTTDSVVRERRCLTYHKHVFSTDERLLQNDTYSGTEARNKMIFAAYTEGAKPEDLAAMYKLQLRTLNRLLRTEGLL